MFGNKKTRKLEADLTATMERVAQLQDLVRATAISLSGVKQAACISALESIAAVAPELVPERQLPMMSLTVVVHDSRGTGVGDEISTLSQTMAYSLQEFLIQPDITGIVRGQAYAIHSAPYSTHTIFIAARYRGEIAACCGAAQSLLKQIFDARQPAVSIDALDKNAQSAMISVVVGR